MDVGPIKWWKEGKQTINVTSPGSPGVLLDVKTSTSFNKHGRSLGARIRHFSSKEHDLMVVMRYGRGWKSSVWQALRAVMWVCGRLGGRHIEILQRVKGNVC